MTSEITEKYGLLQNIQCLGANVSLPKTFAFPYSSLRKSQFDSGQHQQVVRYKRAPHVLLKPNPARPITTGKPKTTFQPRDIGLNASPKISQLLIDPVAFDHLQDRKALFLRKCDILNTLAFGLSQIILAGKSSIRTHLARRTTVKPLLSLDQHWKKGMCHWDCLVLPHNPKSVPSSRLSKTPCAHNESLDGP